jgi:hypothetical protein
MHSVTNLRSNFCHTNSSPIALTFAGLELPPIAIDVGRKYFVDAFVDLGSCRVRLCGACSCSTTSSRTYKRPTSSSSLLRCLILAFLTASARMARAPIATAPAALAPTAKASRLVHASPVTARAKPTCLPNGGYSSCPPALRFLKVLSFPRHFRRANHPPCYDDATKENTASSPKSPHVEKASSSIHEQPRRPLLGNWASALVIYVT